MDEIKVEKDLNKLKREFMLASSLGSMDGSLYRLCSVKKYERGLEKSLVLVYKTDECDDTFPEGYFE